MRLTLFPALFIIAIMVILSLPTTTIALNEEYNKNGEVFVLLGKSGNPQVPAGIYKTSEYKVDNTGKRDVIVAPQSIINSGAVTISQGDGFTRQYYGLAVGRKRECYTYVSEKDGWSSAPPDWKVENQRCEWWQNGCTASHSSKGHNAPGHCVVWYPSRGKAGIKFHCGPKLTLKASYDPATDNFSGFSGDTVMFPCGASWQGWDGSNAPDPVGPWKWVTIKNARIKKSDSNTYDVPCGMFFHNLDAGKAPYNISHKMTSRGRGHCVFMYMGAIKPTNLRRQIWQPGAAAPAWTTRISVGSYTKFEPTKVVFKLFEAKYKIYISTPCGDSCLAASSSHEMGAGKSSINIAITPFGRSYGILTVKDKNDVLQKVELKRHDPDPTNPAAPGQEYSYTPSDWANSVSGRPKINLKIIRSNSRAKLYPNDWTDAQQIATSYKFKATEASFDDKEEFVYLSDAPMFAVADTWFGSGGRAFYQKSVKDDEITMASEVRQEGSSTDTAAKVDTKYFKIIGSIQDIGADGYGNFFFLTSTNVSHVQKLMDTCRSDFDKIKAELTKMDSSGLYPITTNYVDDGWRTLDGTTDRLISFRLPIYKTIYKLSSGTIDTKGTASTGGAPDLSDPFMDKGPIVVGKLLLGYNNCERYAERKSSGAIVWGPITVTGPDYTRDAFRAEIAVMNIAAPPEEKGANYYVDIKGPTTKNPDNYGDRASKANDIVYEGETSTWEMENAPEFETIYGLNINTMGSDENGNNIIGGFRNNVIRDSIAFHWVVYRLYDIKKLALPETFDTKKNESFADQEAAGSYQQVKLYDQWKIYPGTSSWKRKGGTTNIANFPGAVEVASPYKLNFKFKEAGIYKVCMESKFEFYNYSTMSFGENRGDRGKYRLTSDEMTASIASELPGYFNTDVAGGFPTFLHTRDTRFVTVLARDSQNEGRYIKNVTISRFKDNSFAPFGQLDVDEIVRDRFPSSLPSSDATVTPSKDTLFAERETLNSDIDAQLKTKMQDPGNCIVGDFAIKFISAIPSRGDDAAYKDENLLERFGGIGVWDYSPDEAYSNSESGERNYKDMVSDYSKLRLTGNSAHPPNYTAGKEDASTFEVLKVKGTKEYSSDRLAYVKRNYGMHGHGTIVRSLSRDKLDFMQPPSELSSIPVAFRKKIITVNDVDWNHNNGARYPIREIDWAHVTYQWHVTYKINGALKHEAPGELSGNIAEIIRWCKDNGSTFKLPTDSYFVARLGSKTMPGTSNSSDAKNLFTISDDKGNSYNIDNAQMPAFHVRIPMLEKQTTKYKGYAVQKHVRWETPIGPEVYHIGLEIKAPALRWKGQNPDPAKPELIDHKIDVSVDGTKEDRQVFWDLHKADFGGTDMDRAWSGPINDTDPLPATQYAKVFVKDLEPPRLLYTRFADSKYDYAGGTTGDKYNQPVSYFICDNNPNADIINCKPEVFMQFPVNGTGDVLRDLPKRSGAIIHPTENYKLTPPDAPTYQPETEKAFFFTPTKDSEMWGAPYTDFIFNMPVVQDNGPVEPSNIGSTSKTLESTPFMPPTYVGNLFYETTIKMDAMDSNGGTYAQNPFVLDKMYKDKMYFTSTDNDPPEIVIEARTSFTEVDQFLLGLTSQNLSYSYANFSAPSTYAKDVYAAKLRGNDPSNWAESVVDALTGTSSDTYGTAYLTITKGSAARGITSDIGTIASDTTTNSEKIMAGLNTLIKAKMPDYQVQIPERSRAIFSVQVFDNIPEGAAHQMPIDPAASGHIYLQTPNITHANGGDESDLEKFKVEILANHGRDPKREETWNYYGTFHTPMKDNVNDAVVVFSAKDKAGNETMVQVPVKVIDTYVKKDRLDLERQRTN